VEERGKLFLAARFGVTNQPVNAGRG
jgi:hypothetical protein